MKIEWSLPDETLEADSDEASGSIATQLVKLAETFSYFHDSQKRAFVRLKVKDHDEVYPVNSTSFRHLLAHEFYKRAKKAAHRNALADAIMELQGRALYDSNELPVHLRVASHQGNILIDLCDSRWRVIEITPDGWQILDKSPVEFIRTGANRPLPMPVPGGSIKPLWDLLNVTHAQRPLGQALCLISLPQLGRTSFCISWANKARPKVARRKSSGHWLIQMITRSGRRHARNAICLPRLRATGLSHWKICPVCRTGSVTRSAACPLAAVIQLALCTPIWMKYL